MIYDSTYTDEESRRIATGAIRPGSKACAWLTQHVKTLVLFHHDPEHDDAFMDRIGPTPTAPAPGTLVAREGMVLTL